MVDQKSDRAVLSHERQMALSGWDREAGVPSGGLSGVPPLTDSEVLHLRVRVIALENLVISLLATAADHQLDLAREMAAYISPRPGFTPHPLTIHAAHQILDLVERVRHFRDMTT
ncbi:MAG: hypothetical protein ACREU3_10570 [Steroidobacteraceae bacterium]